MRLSEDFLLLNGDVLFDIDFDRFVGYHREKGGLVTLFIDAYLLMAIPLTAHESLLTAYINDFDGTGMFAQQLFGYGRPGDVFLGISTSGNSQNIILAAIVARASGMKVIGLTGAGGGELASIADVTVKVPVTETYIIQELHLPVYHCWCMMLEDKFFGQQQK